MWLSRINEVESMLFSGKRFPSSHCNLRQCLRHAVKKKGLQSHFAKKLDQESIKKSCQIKPIVTNSNLSVTCVVCMPHPGDEHRESHSAYACILRLVISTRTLLELLYIPKLGLV